jgi:uncharacterized protein YjbJ (UPF0337 family)
MCRAARLVIPLRGPTKGIMMEDGKFEDRIDQGAGKAKEWAGRATGDRGLEREGRAQSGIAGAKVKLREAARHVIDVFRERRGNRRRY